MHSVWTLIALVGLCLPAAAHGGAYQGPKDSNPSAGGAGGSAAPTNVNNPMTAMPGSAGGGAATSGAAATRATRGGSGRRGGGGAVSGAPSLAFDGWEFWWEANRDGYIGLKGRLGQASHVSGSPGFLTARGDKEGLVAEPRPTRAWVDDVVVPALLDLSTSTDDRDILDSALIALGRSASPAEHAAVRAACRRLLAHDELSVQGAAALGLGVLGDLDAETLLVHLLLDDSEGRHVVGGGQVPWLVRSFSALGLGLLGTQGAADALLGAIDRLPDSERDVKVCAIAALGLLPADSPQRARVGQALVQRLSDPRLDAVIASYLPTTLGKLGAREALPALIGLVDDAHTSVAVRQSAVIGLGALASLEDEQVTRALYAQLEDGRDQLCRHFALISLARVGTQGDLAPGTPKAHERLRRALRREITGRGQSRAHRSWAALAVAVYGRTHRQEVAALLPVLREAFHDEHDPSFRGAFALALALLDDRQSAPAILVSLEESHQDDYRGYASEALGLLRHRDAAPALRALCRDAAVPETFRIKSAMGLGLLGDREAIPLLVEGMGSARSLAGLSAMAQSLGLIGDQAAAEPLLAMASDEQQRELTRAFATVALGLLGERDELPFNAALRADNNYLYQTPAVAEVLRIL